SDSEKSPERWTALSPISAFSTVGDPPRDPRCRGSGLWFSGGGCAVAHPPVARSVFWVHLAGWDCWLLRWLVALCALEAPIGPESGQPHIRRFARTRPGLNFLHFAVDVQSAKGIMLPIEPGGINARRHSSPKRPPRSRHGHRRGPHGHLR